MPKQAEKQTEFKCPACKGTGHLARRAGPQNLPGAVREVRR
jgi:hypothetical protein